MSPSVFPAAATILLLLLLSPLFTVTAAVVDEDGEAVIAGQSYYIIPQTPGFLGGLTLRKKTDITQCPLYIAQDKETSPGLPVIFYPINSKQHHVTVSTNLNIVFQTSTVCLEPVGWRLTSDYEWYVTTGGVIGNQNILTDWFKIESESENENVYMMKYCPSMGPGWPLCMHLGIHDQDGLLGIRWDDKPLPVKFRKA